MGLVDFSNCKVINTRFYSGANGNKICIEYKDELYMLKFASKFDLKDQHIYTNSSISEHIACKIATSLNINTQETILGTYLDKIVVACKDFAIDNFKLYEFALLKNANLMSSTGGYDTDLTEILETIDNQNIIDSYKLKEFFWDMFIVDALLGNFDRHNGNWGFLINEKENIVKIAPLYDLGSCLYPRAKDDDMEKILNSIDEINYRIYVFPTSALKLNDKKINYLNFIKSNQYEECTRALFKISNNINLEKINKIIDDTNFINSIQKTFYKRMIKERKEKIIDFSIEHFLKNQFKDIDKILSVKPNDLEDELER